MTKNPEAASTVRRAQSHIDAAIGCHVAGNKARAIKELMSALHLNPNLVDDAVFTNLAGQVLGTTPFEALLILQDSEQLKTVVASAPTVRPKTVKKSSVRPFSLILLVTFTVILIGLSVWFVESGLLDRYRHAYELRKMKDNIETLNGLDYYLIVPDGAVPADGWAVIVALHGYGGSGDSMLHPEILDIAEQEGAILIAPTMTTYGEPARKLTNLDLQHRLNAILDRTADSYQVNSRGAVLYGFSRGGMFSTEFLANYSHRIYAIVAEGAPEIIVPGGGTFVHPCVFLYGEQDGLQDFTYTQIQSLQQIGFPVTFEIVPNVGHSMTGRGMYWLREMVRRAHSG